MGIEDPLETEVSRLLPSNSGFADGGRHGGGGGGGGRHGGSSADYRICDCSVSYRVILAWVLSSAVTLLYAHRAVYSQVGAYIARPRRRITPRNHTPQDASRPI
jgi:hypothetical protein